MDKPDTASAGNTIVPSINDYADIYDFLAKHSVYKTNDSQKKNITNTRIGSPKQNIPGGSYNITDVEYSTFLELYKRDIISKNKKEYLTEKQRESDGPIVVDLDFRYNYDVDEKQYNRSHIEDLIMEYGNELKKMYQMDDSTEFDIYVFEKPSVNRIKDKNLTKDGVHILISIQMDRIAQQYLRKQMIMKAKDMWSDLPKTNSWDDVFDEGITKGTVNWQLYGSRKPGYDKYSLTGVYHMAYDSTDEEFSFNETPLSRFDINKNLHKLSVRYKDNLSLFMKNDFIPLYEDFKKNNNMSNQRIPIPTNNTIVQQHRMEMLLDNANALANIKNAEELELALNTFIDSVDNDAGNYELKMLYEYTMVLPDTYYGEGSYEKWIRVGWVLRNTSSRLLIVWIAFSAKSPTFQYNSIPDLCERWQGFDIRLKDGLTKLSLIHWAKTDAFEEYQKVRKNTIDYYVEQTIRSRNPKYKPSDHDLANVLYQMFKDKFVCACSKTNEWYKYSQNRWKPDDSGISLRTAISNELRTMYYNKTVSIMPYTSTTRGNGNILSDEDGGNGNEEEERNKIRSLQICNIIHRLGSTTDKLKIMTEAKELFYVEGFHDKLDMNCDILCFKNGVIDFKQKEFRKGLPEDYISLCANVDYIKLEDKHQPIVEEIHTFMNQLFPEPALCKYMWEHLASTLTGRTPDQTFNMYHGIGQNGKSMLVKLMDKVLGKYSGTVPLSLVTDRRGKIGGLAPEIVNLKGLRYAVLQEPQKGDIINEGVLKQLTSGQDPIQGRAPYSPQVITFYPQFKLVVTCNVLMEVKSNDHGTWRRIRAVPFKSLFTENPVEGDKDKPYQFKIDKKLENKFDTWKSVFASMLVDIVYKTEGHVKDCDIVMSKSNEYRKGQDYISEYISERIMQCVDGRIKKAELNNDFATWYAGNYGGKGPSPKELHEYINKEFGRIHNQVWKGIRIRYETEDDEEDEDISLDDDIRSDEL